MNGIVGKAPIIQRHRDTFLWGKSSSKRLAGRDFISSFISSKFLNLLQKQKEPIENNGFFCKMAESVGIEPTHGFNPVYGLAIRCITILPTLRWLLF